MDLEQAPQHPPQQGQQQGQKRRRINWTPKSAAGLGIAAAVLLLLPFAGWSWWPLLIGLGVLIVIRLLRLDGLMRGWDPHVAGLVVVVLLILRTSPWVWALAISVGILLAGVVRLPRWQLLAVGGVFTAGSIAGFVISEHSAAVAAQVQHDSERQNNVSSFLVADPAKIVRAVMTSVAYDPPGTACFWFTDAAQHQFADAMSAPDCGAALRSMAAKITDPRRYAEPQLPDSAVRKVGNSATVDGCQATWAAGSAAPGPGLGQFELQRVEGAKTGYQVTAYRACR